MKFIVATFAVAVLVLAPAAEATKTRKQTDSSVEAQDRILKGGGKGKGSKSPKGSKDLPTTCGGYNGLNMQIADKLVELQLFISGAEVDKKFLAGDEEASLEVIFDDESNEGSCDTEDCDEQSLEYSCVD